KNRVKVVKDFNKIPKVMAYAGELNQVFMNILSNASQAIEGEGEIHVSTKAIKDHSIEIANKDSGKGMSRETADKVFDPFFTTKSLGQGTGLGMSISYGVIQKHGGEIRIESEISKGTTFRIVLPIS